MYFDSTGKTTSLGGTYGPGTYYVTSSHSWSTVGNDYSFSHTIGNNTYSGLLNGTVTLTESGQIVTRFYSKGGSGYLYMTIIKVF